MTKCTVYNGDEDSDDDIYYDELVRLPTSVDALIDARPSAPSTQVLAAARNQRCLNRVSLEPINFGALSRSTAISGAISSSLKESERRRDIDEAIRSHARDKSHRATVEQVLDARTRLILFKLLNKQIINSIEGCVSTGKEANVYFGATPQPSVEMGRAVKVYKTSILTFKDRDRYIDGEFRFRKGYCKGNPRKMVRTWAEKEFRNLLRMYQVSVGDPDVTPSSTSNVKRSPVSTLRVPRPYDLRGHVVVMEFVGDSTGCAAPRLKDAVIEDKEEYRSLYRELVETMRILYQECRLVHADLSEYNILYDPPTQNDRSALPSLVVIDVSQSVEHDHPRALDFLRSDCANVTRFFAKKGVAVMTLADLFSFITDINIISTNVDQVLDVAMRRAVELSGKTVSDKEKVDEAVFQQVAIHRTLQDVANYERDFAKISDVGDAAQIDLHYHTVTGMKADMTGPLSKPALLEDEHVMDNSDSSDDDNDGQSESGTAEELKDDPTIVRPRDESPASKKARKAAAKEEAREKRKTKTPKHIKKKKIKQSAKR